MKDRYYINSRGTLTRERNTLYFETENDKTPIPIEKVYDIFATEGITITPGVHDLLEETNTTLHVFSYGGKYLGCFQPPKPILSGMCVTKQSEYYLDEEKRLKLARKFVKGSIENLRLTLLRYGENNCCIADEELELRKQLLENAESIPELMEIEGEARKIYYDGFDHVIADGMELNGRSKNPPEDPSNSLMSYGNSMLYGSIVTEIYHTRLDQTVSFLHEPHERRYSLSLDIAEIFKPLIVDRLIIGLANQGKITPDDFEKEGDFCSMNESAKSTFVDAFDERLLQTRKHPQIRRNMSWRRWIRQECHRITKHILEIEEYQPTTAR
ncbi:type I-B CRISPR-associated endonuclease Cas1b [Halorutilales archaeon Cl-col2-1]